SAPPPGQDKRGDWVRNVLQRAGVQTEDEFAALRQKTIEGYHAVRDAFQGATIAVCFSASPARKLDGYGATEVRLAGKIAQINGTNPPVMIMILPQLHEAGMGLDVPWRVPGRRFALKVRAGAVAPEGAGDAIFGLLEVSVNQAGVAKLPVFGQD